MQNDTIGIYMPTHNRVEMLKKAIESVQAQTYQNFALVIVNDGSSDGTQEYLDSLEDPRISVITHTVAKGACASRNEAIRALNTKLVTGLDDDDVFLPHRLEQLLSVYNDKYAFVCSGYYWDYGAHKKPLFTKDKTISLSEAFDLNQCSNQILVDRERIIEVGCFDENIPALQDHDLWVRLIAKYGKAYRTGEPSYIVNDDHSLERISSVNNKLNAISIFEEKHGHLMSKRNKENFVFYRNKINGQPFGPVKYISSLQHGLWGAKTRQFFASCFKNISKKRLDYLKSGRIVEHELFNKLVTMLFPLIATGGTGATRIVLLSVIVYLFGASNNASFSQDIFILLFLNTLLCQSFSFYYYKECYSSGFSGIFKQSLVGLFLTGVTILALANLEIVKNLALSIVLAVGLHIYFMLRVKILALKRFVFLAAVEIITAGICLLLPIFVAHFVELDLVAYWTYSIGLFLASITMFLYVRSDSVKDKHKVPFKRVFKISIANGVGPFGLFFLPSIVGTLSTSENVTITALSIAFCAVVFLVPRAYANTFLPKLDSENLSFEQLDNFNKTYHQILLGSTFCGWALCLGYLTLLIGVESFNTILMFSSLTVFVLASSQLGFVYLTYLTLKGKEGKVLNVHIFSLFLTLIVYWFSLNVEIESTNYTIIMMFCSLACIYALRQLLAKLIYSRAFQKEVR